MRFLFVIAALTLTIVPAVAAEWTQHENARFGYEISIPPGFAASGPQPANGDGQTFVSDDGTQLLRVYGGMIVEGTFESVAERAMTAAEDAGWSLSYERVTPRWTSYSGTRSGMILYARGIALCGGTQFASFEIEYPDDDLDRMHSVIERMVPSLKPTGAGAAC